MMIFNFRNFRTFRCFCHVKPVSFFQYRESPTSIMAYLEMSYTEVHIFTITYYADVKASTALLYSGD